MSRAADPSLGQWMDLPEPVEHDDEADDARDNGNGETLAFSTLDTWLEEMGAADGLDDVDPRMDFEPPEWIRAFASKEGSPTVAKAIAERLRLLPEWLEDRDLPVVRSSSASGSKAHVPDLSASEPLPECQQNKDESTWLVREASELSMGGDDPHYTVCRACEHRTQYEAVINNV